MFLLQVYLNENYAAQELMCWMEIEAFRGIPISDKHVRNVKAKQLRSRYFTKKYFFGPSSPASKEAQRQVTQAGSYMYFNFRRIHFLPKYSDSLRAHI